MFSSDWDKFSQITYAANFGEKPHGDIHTVAVADVPAHDILCGGFPCQPFSLAGVSKKNSLGRKHGFDDEKQGNLFFTIADILDYHKPAAFVLENVKNLKSHDKGRTFQVIAERALLTASHIVPWSADERNRLNPRNGLCLNALHDRAFDRHLMWIDEGFLVRFAPRLSKPSAGAKETVEWLTQFEGRSLLLPKKFSPDPELLKRHAAKCAAKANA